MARKKNPTGAIEVVDTLNDKLVTHRRGTPEDFYRTVEQYGSRTDQYVVQYLVDNEIVADTQGGSGGEVRIFDEAAFRSGRVANPSKPLIVVHASAKNDSNGNPRRVFVVLDKDANIVETIDEGYSGWGALRAEGSSDYSKLPRFNIETTPSEYKALKKIGRKSNPPAKLPPKMHEKLLAMRDFQQWAKDEPVLATAAGAGLGSLAGAMGGYLVGSPGLGSIVGGAIGGYTAAPKDRKGRAAWGGGIGGAFTPVGAVAGGAIAGRKPDKKNNPSVKSLKNKLLK